MRGKANKILRNLPSCGFLTILSNMRHNNPVTSSYVCSDTLHGLVMGLTTVVDCAGRGDDGTLTTTGGDVDGFGKESMA